MIGSLFYFLYFAAFGIYVPYWTLYLNDLKFSPLQIATIYAVPSVSRCFLPVLYGYLADRWSARQSFLTFASIGQILPLLVMIQFHSYVWILILISIFSLFNAVVLPFTEATMQEEQEKGKLDYGRTRLWGTLSFILMAVFYGKLLDRVDNAWVLYGFTLFLILFACLSISFPSAKFDFAFKEEQIRQILSNRQTWIFLLCAFLMYLSHGSFYGFYSIHLAQMGITQSGIGVQWGVAAGSEVVIFFFARWILRTFSIRLIFSISLLVAAVRWLLVYLIKSYEGLLAVQCLHAFTFGAFHITSMRLIHALFPRGFRSLGQSMYSSSTAGLGSVLGVMISGSLWSGSGVQAFLYSSGAALLAFIVSLFFTRSELKAEAVVDLQPSFPDRPEKQNGW